MMGNRITRCFRHGLAMNLAAPPRNPTISIVGGVKAQYDKTAISRIKEAQDNGKQGNQKKQPDHD